MRSIVLAAGAVVFCAAMVWSQAYYEASGQTVAFNLAAGAKSGPAAIRLSFAAPGSAFREIKITQSGSGIISVTVGVTGMAATVAVFDVRGSQVIRSAKIAGGVARIDTQRFAPGMYCVVATTGGRTISRTILVSGKGGK